MVGRPIQARVLLSLAFLAMAVASLAAAAPDSRFWTAPVSRADLQRAAAPPEISHAAFLTHRLASFEGADRRPALSHVARGRAWLRSDFPVGFFGSWRALACSFPVLSTLSRPRVGASQFAWFSAKFGGLRGPPAFLPLP